MRASTSCRGAPVPTADADDGTSATTRPLSILPPKVAV
jgi:hypothetical protein